MKRKRNQRNNLINQWRQIEDYYVVILLGPYVGLSSFSLSNVLGKLIVNYRGLL